MISFLERHLPAPVVILLIALFTLLMSPIIFSIAIPLLFVQKLMGEVFDRRAAQKPCPSCSQILGMDSLRLGREDLRQTRAKYPHGYRVGWHLAICVYCGARLERSGDEFIDEIEYMSFFKKPPDATEA
jgi:hypothetical protein